MGFWFVEGLDFVGFAGGIIEACCGNLNDFVNLEFDGLIDFVEENK